MSPELTLHGIGYASQTVVAALMATGAMTVFAFAFNAGRVLHINPVAAIGSIFAESRRAALGVGFMMHATLGILFAFVYRALLSAIGLDGPTSSIVGAAAMGVAHGYIVSFWVVINVAEHNRWEEFREEGVGLAVIYFVAHIVYGMTH